MCRRSTEDDCPLTVIDGQDPQTENWTSLQDCMERKSWSGSLALYVYTIVFATDLKSMSAVPKAAVYLPSPLNDAWTFGRCQSRPLAHMSFAQ